MISEIKTPYNNDSTQIKTLSFMIAYYRVIFMVIGVGVDIVEISRIESVLDKHGDRFLQRVFPCETHSRSLRSQTVAGWFAAKEAFLKAIGIGLGHIPLSEICIKYNNYGKPYITSKFLLENWRVHLSISHSTHHAVALVIIEEG